MSLKLNMNEIDMKTTDGTVVFPAFEQVEALSPTRDYKLWVYAIIIFLRGKTFVKFGDHRCVTKEEAEQYAYAETVGKLRGLVGSEDIKLILCEDVTKEAIAMDKDFDPTLSEIIDGKIVPKYRKSFDDRMRPFMPGKMGTITNELGGLSRELHLVEHGKELDYHIFEWKDKFDTWKNGGKELPKKVYNARPYLVDAFEKQLADIRQFLLGAATGAGKETSTLALIIHLHDIKKFGKKKIHMAVATIPSTVSELLQELVEVGAMNVDGHGVIDFTRIVPYVTKQWYMVQYNNCKPAVQMFLDSDKVTIVNNVSDIPNEHYGNQVPILFGGWHDLALKSNTKFDKRYKGLAERIGVLSIGEAHQMLGKEDNKMWKAIKKNFGHAFLMPVTGTPYDLIYSGTAAMFFEKNERTLFTRSQIYKDIRDNPDSDYKDFPEYNFYKIDVKDIINELRKDPNWKDDVNGFTWPKFYEWDSDNEKFKYEDAIVWYFKRMFGMNAFGHDQLSIHNAKDLCAEAMKHIIVALPVGTKEAPIEKRLPVLKNLLEASGAVGNYTLFDVYDTDLGKIKEEIANSSGPTITLTCIKHCTGANIPAWGSFVFMRPIGDSVKFFEQATGRVGRSYFDEETKRWKTNCGIFIADLEAIMSLTIDIEDKISEDNDNPSGTVAIINETLENYNYFHSVDGKWVKFNAPDLAEELEKLSATGKYSINLFNTRVTAPTDFNEVYKNVIIRLKKDIDINGNNNKKAKNSIKKRIKQLELDLNSHGKVKNRDEHFHNMKKQMAARIRILAYIKDLKTVQECSNCLLLACLNDDKATTDIMGRTIKYIDLLRDPEQFDLSFFNKWIAKLEWIKNKDVEDLLELTEDRALHDNLNFYAETNEHCREIVREVLKKDIKNNPIVVDFFAGRGGYIVHFMIEASKQGLDIDPKTVYYNDINPMWTEFFKKLNKDFKLGIPESNITCQDARTMEYNMKFDVVIGNPPYIDNTVGSEQNKIYNQCSKLALSLLSDTGLMYFLTPKAVAVVSKRFSLTQTPGIKFIDFTVNKHFDVGTDICGWMIDKTYNGDITVKSDIGTKTYPKGETIYDPGKLTKELSDFLPLYEKLRNLSIEERAFKQNNHGPAMWNVKSTDKKKTKSHIYSLYRKIKDKMVLTYYSSREPCFYNKNKMSISRSKTFTENIIVIGKKDLDNQYVSIEIENDAQVGNIKSFLFSDYFKEHIIKYKAMGTAGFNDCLIYIPHFDKDKKWTNTEVENFFDEFTKN